MIKLFHSSTKVKDQKSTSIAKTKNKGIVIVHVPKKFIGYTANIIIYTKKRENDKTKD